MIFKIGQGIKMPVVLDENAFMPHRAHDADAGLDLFSPEDAVVPARGSVEIDTGVHIDLPTIDFGHSLVLYTVGILKSKSGLNFKHGITSNGTIDVGYTGSIRVKLYNNSDVDYHIRRKDKITQLVIMPVLTPKIVHVDTLGATERGDGGFGSTGR